jgi:hypothetical protein
VAIAERRGELSEIHLKEEEEESGKPCTGFLNSHRTTTTEELVYLLLSLSNL